MNNNKNKKQYFNHQFVIKFVDYMSTNAHKHKLTFTLFFQILFFSLLVFNFYNFFYIYNSLHYKLVFNPLGTGKLITFFFYLSFFSLIYYLFLIMVKNKKNKSHLLLIFPNVICSQLLTTYNSTRDFLVDGWINVCPFLQINHIFTFSEKKKYILNLIEQHPTRLFNSIDLDKLCNLKTLQEIETTFFVLSKESIITNNTYFDYSTETILLFCTVVTLIAVCIGIGIWYYYSAQTPPVSSEVVNPPVETLPPSAPSAEVLVPAPSLTVPVPVPVPVPSANEIQTALYEMIQSKHEIWSESALSACRAAKTVIPQPIIDDYGEQIQELYNFCGRNEHMMLFVRNFFLRVKQMDPNVTAEDMEMLVKLCECCHFISRFNLDPEVAVDTQTFVQALAHTATDFISQFPIF